MVTAGRGIVVLALVGLTGQVWIATPAARAENVGELDEWVRGPIQWLLLPEERHELRNIESRAEALAFIERFWARRDPHPHEPGNTFREAFEQRVEAADVLYVEGAKRGSLTARGRALVLLGPPSHVSVSFDSGLKWEAGGRTGGRVGTRRIQVEEWGYRREDMAPPILSMWSQQEKGPETPLKLTLTFRGKGRQTELIDGEALLKMAVEAAVYGLSP